MSAITVLLIAILVALGGGYLEVGGTAELSIARDGRIEEQFLYAGHEDSVYTFVDGDRAIRVTRLREPDMSYVLVESVSTGSRRETIAAIGSVSLAHGATGISALRRSALGRLDSGLFLFSVDLRTDEISSDQSIDPIDAAPSTETDDTETGDISIRRTETGIFAEHSGERLLVTLTGLSPVRGR
jgi:hypothetical protein